MREIDQVRITLLRLFRGAVRLPDAVIDEMRKAFLHTRGAAIKVQAYGRGLLERFRSHRLITKDFNRQANREYQVYLKEWGEKPLGFPWGTPNGSTRFGYLHNLSITQDYEVYARNGKRGHIECHGKLWLIALVLGCWISVTWPMAAMLRLAGRSRASLVSCGRD